MIKVGFSEWSSSAIFYDRCFVIYWCGFAVLTFGAYTFWISFLCVRLYLTAVLTLTRLPVLLSNFTIHSFIQKTVITYLLWARHCAGGTTVRITNPNTALMKPSLLEGSECGLSWWMLHVSLKRIYFCCCWKEYSINVNRSSWLIVLFRTTIFYWFFCLSDLLVTDTEVLKSLTLIINLSIVPPVIYHNYHLSVATSLCFQQLLFQVSRSDQIGLFMQISGWKFAL